MKLPESAQLALRMTQEFGVRVSATFRPVAAGTVLEIAPTDLHPSEGFTVEALLGWRSIEARFLPGRFAAGLVAELGRTAIEDRRAASAFLTAIHRGGGRVTFSVNNSDSDPSAPESWPLDPWRSVVLAARSRGVVLDELDSAAMAAEIMIWTGSVLGAVIALAGVEEAVDLTEYTGLPEGARTTVTVNRYERSRINRAACIAAFGTICRVCGFDFTAVYGHIAAGYIHVHHVKPVSELGPDYIVDPTTDLVPVCPNCHVVIHMRQPPYAVAEVREMLSLA